MDLIDPDDAFNGSNVIDGNDLLQALSDNVDILDFHSGNNSDGNGSGNNNNMSSNRSCHSEPLDSAIFFQGSGGGGSGCAPHSSGNGNTNVAYYNMMGSRSSNRSCSSEPFMLDSDFSQEMATTNTNNISNNITNNNNSSGVGNNHIGNIIGTTIKAHLPPLEPLQPTQQQRGRTKRAPRRKARCSRSNSADALTNMYDEHQPLFGGGGRGCKSVQSDDNFGMEQWEFGDNMMFSNNEASDVASACSAPADLFELGGIYDTGEQGMGAGAGAGGDGNYDPTSIPDVMDIQRLIMMRGLLGEGCGDVGNNSNVDACFQLQQQQHQPQQQQRRIYRRRNTVEGTDGALTSSLTSRGSQENKGGGSRISRGGDNNVEQRRRRKTPDNPFSIIMSAMGVDETTPTMGQLQTDIDVDYAADMFPVQNSGVPMKRRKSEPLINSDFWEDATTTDDVPMNNIMGAQQQSTNNVSMPLNINAPNQGNAQANMMSSTFIAAAREAFESINRLNELMNGSASGTMGAGAQMHASQVTTSTSSRAGGMTGGIGGGQQQSQWQQQRHQQKRQVQPSQQVQGFPTVQGKSIPTEFAQQGDSSNQYAHSDSSAGSTTSAPSSFTMNQQEAPAPRGCHQQLQQRSHQWQQQGHQHQRQMQLQGFPVQDKSVPNEFVQQGNPSNQHIRKGSSAGSTTSAPSSNTTNQQEAPAPQASKSKSSPKSSPATVSPTITPQIPLPDEPDPELLKLDQGQVMVKLQTAMDRTADTQQLLQEWDRANGLPKSHSQTMVNSSRSRKQLTDGVILKKWNGAPLLNFAKEGQGVAASRLNMP